MSVKVIKSKQEQQLDWNVPNYALGISSIFISAKQGVDIDSSQRNHKVVCAYMYDSIFYTTVTFIPWAVIAWKQP